MEVIPRLRILTIVQNRYKSAEKRNVRTSKKGMGAYVFGLRNSEDERF